MNGELVYLTKLQGELVKGLGEQAGSKNGLSGTFHVKMIGVDSGVAVWHGGSSAAKSSRKKIECMSRMRGGATRQFVSG